MNAFSTNSFISVSAAALAATLSAATAFAAPPGQVRASGKTLATSQLATDVLNKIAAYTTTNRGCAALDAVDMRVMQANYAPRQPLGSTPSRAGHFELWTVDACGSSQQFEVRLVASPKGGSDFSVMPLTGRVSIASPTSPTPPTREAPQALPLTAWQGRYVWEEPLGRIGGSSPAEGVAAFVTHTLTLGPGSGATGCTLNAEGFQTYTRTICTATPSGPSVVIKFYKAGPENVGGRHAVGDRLLTLTRDNGGIATRLEGLSPASDATPRAGRFFKKVG